MYAQVTNGEQNKLIANNSQDEPLVTLQYMESQLRGWPSGQITRVQTPVWPLTCLCNQIEQITKIV